MSFKKMLKLLIFFSVFLLFCSYTYIFSQLPDDIHDLKRVNFYDNSNQVYLSTTNDHPSTWVSIDDISPNVIKSLISIEDKKFYTHTGFDFARIVKTIIVNTLSSEIKGGASTITQQYVKNIFLSNAQTYSRKLKEVYIGLLIENKYTKDEILEGFLNNVYFGHGVYGIEDASIYFFSKPSNHLTIEESASLISILNAPEIYSPVKNFQNNITRTDLIMYELFQDGKITSTDYIKSKPIVLNINENHRSNINFFQSEVMNILNQFS